MSPIDPCSSIYSKVCPNSPPEAFEQSKKSWDDYVKKDGNKDADLFRARERHTTIYTTYPIIIDWFGKLSFMQIHDPGIERWRNLLDQELTSALENNYRTWLKDKCPPPSNPTGTAGSGETQGVGSTQATGTQALARKFDEDAKAYEGLLPNTNVANVTINTVPWHEQFLNSLSGIGRHLGIISFVPAPGQTAQVGAVGTLVPVRVK